MPYLSFIRAYETYSTWIQGIAYFFLVLADCLNALAVGAPLDPTLRIFSGDQKTKMTKSPPSLTHLFPHVYILPGRRVDNLQASTNATTKRMTKMTKLLDLLFTVSSTLVGLLILAVAFEPILK